MNAVILFITLCMTVFSHGLEIGQISDLNFPAQLPGSAKYVIPAGTTENNENASFRITGIPNTAYSITLPNQADMLHDTSSDKIRLSKFTSYPAEGSNGLLDGAGQQLLLIGATRANLTNNQATGNYSVSFTVTVIY